MEAHIWHTNLSLQIRSTGYQIN